MLLAVRIDGDFLFLTRGLHSHEDEDNYETNNKQEESGDIRSDISEELFARLDDQVIPVDVGGFRCSDDIDCGTINRDLFVLHAAVKHADVL